MNMSQLTPSITPSWPVKSRLIITQILKSKKLKTPCSTTTSTHILTLIDRLAQSKLLTAMYLQGYQALRITNNNNLSKTD